MSLSWASVVGEGRACLLLWIFIIRDTDKVVEGLMVLFFGLVFSVGLLTLDIFLPTPLIPSVRLKYFVIVLTSTDSCTGNYVALTKQLHIISL